MNIITRFSIFCLTAFLAFTGTTSAQTIASEGFNNSMSLFSVENGTANYFSGNSNSGDRPQSSAYAVEGTHALGVTNANLTVTSNNINTIGYTSIQMSFRLAAWSIGSTGNGMETGDYVLVSVSPNGGTTWYETLRVNGNSSNNSWWHYSASGNASTAYDGNTSVVVFNAPTGGENPNGHSTVTITSLPATTNLKIKIQLLTNASSERWTIDDFKVTGASSNTIDGAYLGDVTPSSIGAGNNTTVTASVYDFGFTEAAGQATGISGWIGYSATNSNPSTGSWTWVPASYIGENDTDDVYAATFGSSLPAGTYYIAARFQKQSQAYVYAGDNGFWDNDSKMLIIIDAPAIVVEGNGQVIANGDDTPSVLDNTDFGSADYIIPESAPRTFTIRNTGAEDLEVYDILLTGPGEWQWTNWPPTPATVPPGGSLDFDLEFMPYEVGVHVATVEISSNDPANSVYTFDITGIGTSGAPLNDECENAQGIFPGNTVTGSTSSATVSSPFAGNGDVWYTFTANCNGTLQVSTTTTGQNIDLYIWSGICPMTSTGYAASGTSTSLTSESLTINVSSGLVYKIRVVHNASTPGSSEGSFDLTLNYTSSLTLNDTGNPAAGSVNAGTTNAVLFGFALSPANTCVQYNFTSVSIATSGTATSSDLTNFRLIYDANANGVADPGEISSPVGAATSLSNPINFTLTGQTNLNAGRRYLLIANVESGAIPSRTFTASLASAGVTSNMSVTGTASGNTQMISGTAPVLTAASNATVDNPYDITFADDVNWRSNITSVTINGTPLTAGYSVSAGQITFTPSASSPANLLQTAGTLSVVVIANGYNDATVSQGVSFGAPTSLAMSVQPTAPSSNGGVLQTQPVISFRDQYGNAVTDATNTVIASVGSGAWTLGGNTSVNAVSGMATFSGLTVSSAAAVTGATISFSSPGLTGVVSGTFNIPAPDFMSLTALGVAATENFNTLTQSGTSSILPQGWYFTEAGNSGNGTFAAGVGSETTGDTYSYGSTSNSDRALGGLASNNLQTTIGAKIKNNTGTTISALTISYTTELWRLGATGRQDVMEFGYSTDATSLTSGTYTAFAALDALTPTTTGTTGARNGNQAPNFAQVSATITGLSIPDGATFWIKFADSNISGNDDGLAIDDFSITACGALTASIDSNNSAVCSGSDAEFNLTGTPGATVTYIINGGSNETVELDGAGEATVIIENATYNQTMTLVSVASGACSLNISDSSTVIVVPLSDAGTISGNQTICYGSEPSDITLTDSVGDIQWQSSEDNENFADINGANSATLAGNAIGNLSVTTYFRAVVNSMACGEDISDVVTITVNATNEWTGSNGTSWADAGNWSCGAAPTAVTDVIIPATENKPVIAEDVAINSLTLESGAALTVTSGFDLTVTNAVDVEEGATMIVQNNANLLQVNDVANSGNITVKRNSSALKLYDYTLWSSPVEGQNLLAFSPLTLVSPTSRFYFYNTETNFYNAITAPGSVTFGLAKGYLIRMPNNHPTTPTIYPGSFTGVPHNGNLQITMIDGGENFRYNLVGNPYPSPISIEDFIEANEDNITGMLYFWRKTNNAESPSYCSWKEGTFLSNGEAQVFDPNGVIQTGQGFFVEGTGAGTTLVFNNQMRVGNNAGQFFRTASVEKHRIWLNATSESGAFSQTAIVYAEGGDSNGLDKFDGKYMNDGPIALTSVIADVPYAIQGRAPFVQSDVVPLRFKASAVGQFTIALDHVDGLFSGNQQIYLRDNQNGIVTNLKNGSYTFTSGAGTHTGRFDVIYDTSLAVVNPQFDNSVVVYNQGSMLAVNAGSMMIDNIKVYDVRGRLIVSRDDINATEALIDAGEANQVLIVKVTSVDHQVATRKVVK